MNIAAHNAALSCDYLHVKRNEQEIELEGCSLIWKMQNDSFDHFLLI